MVQRVSEKISEMDAVTTLSRAAVFPVTDGNASYRVPLPRISRVFNVLNYGATGDGVATSAAEAAAFLRADTEAALVGGVVYVPKGTYGNGTDWNFSVSSGVSVEGDGQASVLRNCYLTCFGTVGSEIAFTAPATVGATTISIPSTGLDNTWVRLSSVINSQSSDAGIYQLGNVPTGYSNLAEFALIETGGASTATLSRGTLFPYSNTPGADTKAGQTTSVARVVTFHQSARIRNVSFLGKNSTQNNVIHARWCRDLLIENVALDSNNLTSRNIEMVYCLDSHIVEGRNIGRRTGVPAGSTANQLIISSCQDCDADGMSFEGGNQCVDITYDFDTIYRGGPSIDCGAVNCRATNMESEGFTSHEGSLRCFFENCTVKGGSTGIRIRSRGDSIRNCRMTCRAGGGSGALVMGAALFDSDISHNRIDGYVFGVEYRSSETGYDSLRASLAGGAQCSIEHNSISNTSSEGIVCQQSPALNTLLGPKIRFNSIYAPGADGIEIGSYVNGAIIDQNRITGIAASQRGIRWNANIKRLWIGTNWVYSVNAAGFGLGGPSVSAFMSDAVTFPAGEAEAFLYVGDLFTDAVAPVTGILRNTVAYDWAYAAGYGAAGTTLLASRVLRGAGSPEGVVFAPLGATYERTDGGAGTSHYFKESAGTLSTGWVAK